MRLTASDRIRHKPLLCAALQPVRYSLHKGRGALSQGAVMTDDERCCGTGTCIINAEGYCWCGQRWDGEKMCFPDRQAQAVPDTPVAQVPGQAPQD